MGHSAFRHLMAQGVIEHGDLVELAVTAQMIEMGMCVNDYHWFVGYLFDSLTKVANSASRVDQGCLLLADHQVDDGTFIVPRLVENKQIVGNLISFEPIL